MFENSEQLVLMGKIIILFIIILIKNFKIVDKRLNNLRGEITEKNFIISKLTWRTLHEIHIGSKK